MSTTTLVPSPAEVRAPGPPPVSNSQKWRRRVPLLPALIFSIAVTQLPFLATIVISFLN